MNNVLLLVAWILAVGVVALLAGMAWGLVEIRLKHSRAAPTIPNPPPAARMVVPFRLTGPRLVRLIFKSRVVVGRGIPEWTGTAIDLRDRMVADYSELTESEKAELPSPDLLDIRLRGLAMDNGHFLRIEQIADAGVRPAWRFVLSDGGAW